jgi:sec-independent protein translocase protein TatA
MVDYTQLIALGMPSGWEWIVILIVALLIFGKKLPDVARGLGKSLTQFKKGLHDVEDEVEQTKNEIESSGQDNDNSTKNDASKT